MNAWFVVMKYRSRNPPIEWFRDLELQKIQFCCIINTDVYSLIYASHFTGFM